MFRVSYEHGKRSRLWNTQDVESVAFHIGLRGEAHAPRGRTLSYQQFSNPRNEAEVAAPSRRVGGFSKRPLRHPLPARPFRHASSGCVHSSLRYSVSHNIPAMRIALFISLAAARLRRVGRSVHRCRLYWVTDNQLLDLLHLVGLVRCLCPRGQVLQVYPIACEAGFCGVRGVCALRAVVRLFPDC